MTIFIPPKDYQGTWFLQLTRKYLQNYIKIVELRSLKIQLITDLIPWFIQDKLLKHNLSQMYLKTEQRSLVFPYAWLNRMWTMFVEAPVVNLSWWRHHVDFFRVTGLREWNPPVTRSFDVFFDLRLNKRLSKWLRPRWFETQSRSLWRPCNVLYVLLAMSTLRW